MKIRLIISGLLFLIIQCSTADRRGQIIGSWKVDSVYTYYNGFAFTRKDVGDEPLLEYQADGKLKMTKGDESRFFLFDTLIQDTLVHRYPDHKVMDKFLLQKLNKDQLVLRKDLRPVFSGHNQVRYEVRYLSVIK